MLKKINMLLFSLFILQLPASLIKFFFYGMSELTIGTYASRGGGLTTVIPIVAIAYLSAYFALYKPKPIYIVLIVGFVGFGILGRKRALLFIYPVAFLGIYIFLFLRGTRVGLMKQLITIICVVVFSMGLFAFMLKYNRSFNVEGKVGGSIDTGYALKFAKDYTTRKTGQSATGRVATTLVAFNDLFRAGIGQLFLGFGPGCLTGSLLQDKGSYFDKRVVHTQRSYGRTGAVYIATEYGLMGLGIICFVFLVFIFISYRCYKLEEDPYWKAFAAGSVIFAIYEAFIFFCYSDLAVTDDTIVPVYYYAMSVMYIRQKRLKSLYLSTNVK
ncbi:MAG: hypothetical protein KAI50_11400 [Desulfobacterales bacterium]|nr:hypothetical protein [Desulfobacterales bacterium]